VPPLDTGGKLDGRAQYGLDVRLPGMLRAVVARCPVFGGRLASFDATAARGVPGVRHVVPVSSGVAVVAETLWAARRGLEALTATWDEGALAALDSAAISRTYAARAREPGARVRRDGDGAAALARAARTLEAEYETPYLAHATMEPTNCVAWVKRDTCEVWVGSQNASGVQRTAANLTGLPPEAVTVHLMLLGGGFGRRHEMDAVTEAVEISKAVGTAVQVVWSREEEMRHDFYRPATYHLLRAGLDATGAPIAWAHRMVGPAIIARLWPEAVRAGVDPSSVDVASNLPYAFPHVDVEYALHEPGVPTGWWRSVSASQNAYAIECFIDELAAAAGRDPVEFRIGLLADKPRHRAVLKIAAEKSGWGNVLPEGHGRGIAVVESFGSYVAQVAEVSVNGDGAVRVHRVVCAVDCGRVVHPDLVVSQMESGILYGLSAALFGEITIEKGRVLQGNFDDYPIVTMPECPAIEVHLAPGGDPIGGIGEVGLPPIAPAVVNAIAAVTGKRIRRLPVRREKLAKP
jgi:isoquinoline 1-oxidoreductase beta subunit